MDHDLPVSETLGVLFGILGVDWLANGQADVAMAAMLSVGVGAIITLSRYWRHKHPKE